MKILRFPGDSGSPSDDGHSAQHEALEWLKSNKSPCAFAGNRFDDTAGAVEFVQALYNCGAKEVLISGICDEQWRIGEEGGPYADTLIVTLPEDKAQREAIMRIYRTECSEYECNDGDANTWIRGDTLTLWWD